MNGCAFLGPSVSLAVASVLISRTYSIIRSKTIYLAPSSDDFVRLLKSRLEQWGTVKVTPQVEEADAILSCETESRIVLEMETRSVSILSFAR